MPLRNSFFAAALFAGSVAVPGQTTPSAEPPPIKPGDNLVVEGVPPVPASLADEVWRYTEFRSASFSSWHPTRHEMMISTRLGNVAQAYLVRMPGGARTQVTFYPERVTGARFQPKTGDSFLFSKDIGGNERFQIYRYDFADGSVTLLTDGRSRNTGAKWSRDGQWIAYGSTRRTGDDIDIYIVGARNPKTDRRVLELSGGGWQVADWSPDDTKLLVFERISLNETYLWLADVATGAKTVLTPKGKEPVAYGDAAFSHDGKGLYLTTDAGSEFRRLAYMDLATKKTEFLTPDTAEVEEFDLSEDGSKIVYVTNEKGVSVVRLFETATRRELTGPKLPLGEVSGATWHKNGGAIAFTMGTPRSADDAWSWDWKTGKLDRWTTSEVGGLNPETFAEAELVTWKSFDGREISCFLYKPSPAKFPGRRPVVIDIHGGPEGQSAAEFIGRDNYFPNEMGVAMLFPNVRGSTGYGKTFSKLDNGMLRDGTYKDIGALLDWIATRAYLYASRIMAQGGSYGGHMTLAVAYLYSDRIRCAIDVVGPSNFVTFLQNTSGYRRHLRRVEYGDEREPAMRAYFEKTAPLNNAAKIRKPLFIIQGGNDPRVPLSESEQMLGKIRSLGTPVWYLMAKDEGHGFAKRSNRDFEFFSSILFMREFLLQKP